MGYPPASCSGSFRGARPNTRMDGTSVPGWLRHERKLRSRNSKSPAWLVGSRSPVMRGAVRQTRVPSRRVGLLMHRHVWVAVLLCGLSACTDRDVDSVADRKAAAERFFRGVYGCGPEVVPELAADSVAISYPIFQELFNTLAIRGNGNVEAFATGFCTRWKEAEVTVHEAIAEGDRVVLVWSYRARNVADGALHSWGGISLFQFDHAGRIIAEIGEESAPGPFERSRGN